MPLSFFLLIFLLSPPFPPSSFSFSFSLSSPAHLCPLGVSLKNAYHWTWASAGWPHLGIVNLIAHSRTPFLNKITVQDSRTWCVGIAFQRALQSTAILAPWQVASTAGPEANESWALRHRLSQFPFISMDVMIEADEEQKERLNTNGRKECKRGSWEESFVGEVLRSQIWPTTHAKEV